MKSKFIIFALSCLMACGAIFLNLPQANAVTDDVACVTAPSGMQAWWSGDGNATDIRGGHNGTWVNGEDYATGVVNQAFHFDGTSSRIKVNSAGIVRGSSEATIDAWIRPLGPQGEDDGQIFSENTNAFDYTRFGIYITSDGQVSVWGRPTENGEPVVVITDETVSEDEWTHVAATWKSTEGIRVYINGQLVDQLDDEVGSFTSTDSNDIGIGGATGESLNETWYPFNGDIDELEVFTRALSQTEIQSIFDAGSAGKCRPVVPSTPNVTDPSDNSTIKTGTPTFKGTADANNTVLLTVQSDVHNYTATVDANGNWQFTIPDADKLGDGEHTLIVQARDSEGNLSGTRTIHFTVSTALTSIPVTGGNLTLIGYLFGLLFMVYAGIASYKLLKKN